MTDINSGLAARRASAKPATADGARPRCRISAAEHARLIAFVEMLFFAYRGFTAEPDAILRQFGFGRAHHRVLHFINRRPGIRVADLLDILKITKQSLARVLKQLIDEGFVESQAGETDRRVRRLQLTPKGAELANRLARLQTERFADALGSAGPGAEQVTRQFLAGMIAEEERARVEWLIGELQAGSEARTKE
jgi:DNA-binding MarR family transcriptional regulator